MIFEQAKLMKNLFKNYIFINELSFTHIAIVVLFFFIIFFTRRNQSYNQLAFFIGLFLISIFQRYRILLNLYNYNPLWLISGLLTGHLLFFVSLIINRLSLKEALKFSLPFKSIYRYYLSHKLIVRKYFFVSLYEEFLWRGTIQYLLGSSYLAVTITAFLFTITHVRQRGNNVFEILDLLLFAFLLGLLFFCYQNILFVIILHAIRNINISYYHSICSSMVSKNLATDTHLKIRK